MAGWLDHRRRWLSRALSQGLQAGLVLVVGTPALSACGADQVRYDVVVDSAAGLISGNRVRIAGIDVGRVVELRVADQRAILQIEVDADIPIYADAQAYTAPNNTFGERHLRLDPGAQSSDALPPGSTIESFEPALDVPLVLNQFKPLVDDKSESSYPKLIYGVQVWNSVLSLAFGDPAVEGPPDSKFLSVAAAGLGVWDERIRSLLGPLREGLGDAEQALIDAVAERLLEHADRRMAALEGEIEGTLDGLDERLAKLEAELDTFDPEALAELKDSLERTAALAASMRASSEAYEAFDEELLPMLQALLKITARLREVDGRALRLFFQVEGMRSNLVGAGMLGLK